MSLTKAQKAKNAVAVKSGFALMLFVALFVANFAAAQIPVTTDSRIRTLVYNPNEVYELKFYYNYQSFVEFSEDEEIEMISTGEAFAWRLTPAGKRLFIRPLEIAAHTNMTIITNRRTYHFDIRSAEFSGKADEDLVYTIRFFYPQIGQPLPIPPQLNLPNAATRLAQVEIPMVKVAPEKPAVIKTVFPGSRVDKPLQGILERNPDDKSLNFEYSVAGKSDNILPLKVYDNGSETMLQFPGGNEVVPSISTVDDFGNEHVVNYTIRDDYVVVSTVAKQFTLRKGDGLLCIYNNALIKKEAANLR